MPVLNINGRAVTVDDSFLSLSREDQDATVDEIAKSLPSDKKEPSVADGLAHGLAEVPRGLASTAKRYAGVGDGGKQFEQPNYEPADVTHGSWNPLNWDYTQVPRKIAEMAPSTVAGMPLAAAGASAGKKAAGAKGALIGGLAGGALASLGLTAGDTAKERAVSRTGDQNAEPDTNDLVRGGATAALASIPGALIHTRIPLPKATVGLPGVAAAATRAAATPVVGGAGAVAQDAITQAGTTGTVDPSRLPEAFASGAAATAPYIAPRAASDTLQAATMGKFGGTNAEATKNYATRLQDTGIELGNAKRDAQAHEMVKADLRNELADAAKNVRSQKQIDADTDNALQRAQSGAALSDKDVETIRQGVAGTADGDNAAHLAHTMRVAQMAEGQGSYGKDGWAGGISGTLDKNLGYMLNPTRIIGGGIASLAGMHLLGLSNPMFAGSVAGGYLASRVLDGTLGTRSPAATFAQHFADRSAQLRIPPTQQAAPPQPPQPTNTPWGPRPPMSGPTGPQVAPPAPPQAPTGPWGPKPPPTTSVPPVQQAAPAAPAPQFNPIAMAMLKQQLKNPPQAPSEISTQTSDTAVPKDVLSQTRALVSGLENVQRIRDANYKVNQAQAVSENKARDKAASDAEKVEAARLRAASAQMRAVSAPKITKRGAQAEVKADPPSDPWADVGGYTPLEDHRMVFKGRTPAEMAKVSADQIMVGKPELSRIAYENSALDTRLGRAEVTNGLKQDFPQHSSLLDSMLEQLMEPGNSDIERSKRVIKHYTDQMEPQAAQATRERFLSQRARLWPTRAEKRAKSAAKKKAEKEKK